MSDLVETSPLLKSKFAGALMLAVAVVVADQLTKVWFYTAGTSNLNQGISLSFGSFFPSWILTLSLIVFMLALAFYFRKTWISNPWPAALLFGGAAGNLIDRIWLGGVRDWWTVPVWGVKNNLADWAVCFGVIWLIIAVCSPSKFYIKTKT